MTISRINFTGRKRINQTDTEIRLLTDGNNSLGFWADINLENYSLPANAKVYVEAHRETTWMRFSFGTVSDISTGNINKLSEFNADEGIRFRVKVISCDEPFNLLLAEADKIKPRKLDQDDEEKESLLPVRPDDNLGSLIWQIELRDSPIILINSKLENWRAVVTDPVFASLSLPSILRQILLKILLLDCDYDINDQEEWTTKWLLFAKSLPGTKEVPPKDEDEDVKLDWIDIVIASFARKHKLLEGYRNYWEKENNS